MHFAVCFNYIHECAFYMKPISIIWILLGILPFSTGHCSWAETIFLRMTCEEKIAQLIVMRIEEDYDKNTIQDFIRKYKIGAIIPLQTWSLHGYRDTIITLTNLYPHTLNVPLLVIQDAEWGANMRIPEISAFPHAMTLGAIDPLCHPLLVYNIGYAIGQQCKTLGININCAPVLDINTNSENPVIGMRSFSDNAKLVIQNARMYSQGLYDAGIVPCFKHFPGHGNTNIDSHTGLPILDSTPEEIAYTMSPFNLCAEFKPCTVMIGHLAIPALEPENRICPSSLSPTIIQTLTNSLAFDGLIITDALDMKALAEYGTEEEVALAALKAGADILLCPQNPEKVILHITNAIKQKKYSEQDLNKHVLKILQFKEKIGVSKKKSSSAHYPERYQELIQNTYNAAATAYYNLNSYLPLTEPYSTITLSDTDILETSEQFPHDTNTQLLIYLYPGNKTHRLSKKIQHDLNVALAANQKSIILLFGSPYCLKDIPPGTPTLILYEDTIYTHNTAKLILRGIIKAQGKVPISIS